MRYFCLISAFLLITCISSHAGDNRWWQKDQDGWFFYDDSDLPKEEVEKEPVEDPKPVSVAPAIPATPSLFTEQLQEKGKELLSAAMQAPTPDNMQNYLRWNKFMMDISTNFAYAWQKQLMASPDLSYDIPASDSVKDIYFVENRKNKEEIIREISEHTGLFFFYRTTCPYCERQILYLNEFARSYGYDVKAVSLDGGIYPEFPDALIDNGIAARLGVEKVPAIFLAFPNENRFERLSSGLVTIDEIKQRILYYAQEIDTNIQLTNYTD